MDKLLIDELNQQFKHATAQDVLAYFIHTYPGLIALSSSLGAEDQVLTSMVCDIDKSVRIFTLDTGRLFPQTYELIDKTNRHFGISLEVFFPEASSVESMVRKKGVNLFYESVSDRKECCKVRKLEPLARAFKNLQVWICGLRKEQSVTRQGMHCVEWDEGNGLIKLNPLIDWSETEVWDYIEQRHIPVNSLHQKGFPSIGCQPCTRAVEKGADIRSGRWWWEDPEHKECGLHNRSTI